MRCRGRTRVRGGKTWAARFADATPPRCSEESGPRWAMTSGDRRLTAVRQALPYGDQPCGPSCGTVVLSAGDGLWVKRILVGLA